MRKLFSERVAGDEIHIVGDDHKHIAYSLRMRPGDEITICAGGVDHRAVIEEIGRSETVARIVGAARNTSELDFTLDLYFGAIKGDRNDYVVQKCTELGVGSFRPFVSAFSSVAAESVRADRLSRIALEAAKQSGRGKVPEVYAAAKLNDLFGELKTYDLVVFPYEQEEERPLRSALEGRAHGRTAVVIGSEGGFSAAEAEALRGISGGAVTLGERILRAETACVAVVATVAYEFGQWSGRR